VKTIFVSLLKYGDRYFDREKVMKIVSNRRSIDFYDFLIFFFYILRLYFIYITHF